MSRSFIAFYSDDYQRKTQHLDTLQHGAYFLLLQHCWTHGSIPPQPEARAAIARMTLKAWQKIAPVADAFFDAEGRNKRASEEIEKADLIRTKRAIAGKLGGLRSGTSKAIAKLQQTSSKQAAFATQLPSNCVPIQNVDIKTTTDRVERADGSKLTATPQLLASIHRRQARPRKDPTTLSPLYLAGWRLLASSSCRLPDCQSRRLPSLTRSSPRSRDTGRPRQRRTNTTLRPIGWSSRA
jgi:uncharacterized protein YdaU (DUF1376 family)